jgi:hypothetical protein
MKPEEGRQHHKHAWVPVELYTPFESKPDEQVMVQACACGAWRKIKAFEVEVIKEENDG